MRIRDVFRAVGWIICTLIPGRGEREARTRAVPEAPAEPQSPPWVEEVIEATMAWLCDIAAYRATGHFPAERDSAGIGPAAVSVPPTPPAAGHSDPPIAGITPAAESEAQSSAAGPPGAAAMLNQLTELIDEHKSAYGWPNACTGCAWRGFDIHASHVAQLVMDAVKARPAIHIEHYNVVTGD
ncbi:MAG: hypothetical protein U5N53_28365 [Mycobacterium sp.]|nr:hypothetical protein [Mycobacterium sp.]